MSTMNVSKFVKELLPKYASATNAKRAVGRAHLTPEEKDKVRVAIDKHFGVSSAPAKASKKKKSTAKKASKKKSTVKKVAAKADNKPRGRKKTAKKKKASRKSSNGAASAPTEVAETVETAEAAAGNGAFAVSDRITLLGSVVANAVAGIQALDFGRKTSGSTDFDIQEGVSGAGVAITNAMKQLGRLSSELADTEDAPEVSEEELLNDPSTVHSTPGAASKFTQLVTESNKASTQS